MGRISAAQTRSVTSNTEPSRLDAVSSGPKMRNVVGLAADDVPQEGARDPGRLAATWPPGAGTVHRVVAEVRAAPGPAARARHWPWGWRSSVGRPAAPAPVMAGTGLPSASNSSSGSVAAQPRLEDAPCARAVRGHRRAAPGGTGSCPRWAARRPPWVRSSPWASGGSIIGHAGRCSLTPASGRAAGWWRCRSSASSIAAAMSWCIAAGSSPSTKIGR